jgi:ADP-ribosylglycohydrolase
MDGVPPDDDIAYTLLGLLIAEQFGLDFTTEDVGKAWVKYLPIAYTAEAIALDNIKKGIPAKEAAEINNPYVQLIGADIRSDPFAYIAAGYPEKAAEMAYQDAYLSHRRNGIYGDMLFAAAQAAAFTVDDAVEAIKIGLTEIPKESALYKDVTWALDAGKGMKNYLEARQAVDERFPQLGSVHTNNNACLTVFGLMIGGHDVTKVLSELVAMGMDNDCTAATAGSIVGAIVGKKGIPAHWYKPFNNKVLTYLIGEPQFYIDDLVLRFTKQAEKLWGGSQ